MSNFVVNPYRFVAAECTEATITDKTGDTTTYISTQENGVIVGTKILSGNSLIGESLDKLTFNLKTPDTLTGNVVVGVVSVSTTDGSFDTIMQTVDVTTLSIGSSYSQVTFEGDGGEISENDVLGIKFAGSGGSIDVKVNNATPNMSNQEIRYLDGTTWTNNGYFVFGSMCTS